MGLKYRVERLEKFLEDLGSQDIQTDAMIRASAHEEGVPEEIMFEVWDKLVGRRWLDFCHWHIFYGAITCYKLDPEEYRRRVAENNWKGVPWIAARKAKSNPPS